MIRREEGQHFKWAIPKRKQQQPQQKSPNVQQKTHKPQQPQQQQSSREAPEAVVQQVRYIEELKQYLRYKVQNFEAGSVRKHVNQWKSITTDIEILQTVIA